MPMTDQQFAVFQVVRDDVLLNEGQSLELVGRCAIYRDEFSVPCAMQNQLLRFRAYKEVSPLFAAHLFRHCQATGIFAKIALQTTSIAHLGGSRFARLTLAWPSTFEEQQAIAEVLSDADALIDSLEFLIAKKRAVKLGAMQDLLSGRKRLPGYSREWDYVPFGSVFDFLPTATNSRADLEPEGDAYYVHYGDIHMRFHTHLDFGVSATPKIARTKCPTAAPLCNGDWIMADASEDFDGVGKSVEVRGLGSDDVAVAGLHTFLLRERVPTFVPGFKGHLGAAEYLRKQYMRVMTGMKVYGVSKTALRDLLIPVPPADEQAALVEVLDDFNADIAALETRLGKARQIKQGMMQELLTGRVRLA